MKSNYGKDIHSKDMHIIQVLNIPSTQCVQDLFVSISCKFILKYMEIRKVYRIYNHIFPYLFF